MLTTIQSFEFNICHFLYAKSTKFSLFNRWHLTNLHILTFLDSSQCSEAESQHFLFPPSTDSLSLSILRSYTYFKVNIFHFQFFKLFVDENKNNSLDNCSLFCHVSPQFLNSLRSDQLNFSVLQPFLLSVFLSFFQCFIVNLSVIFIKMSIFLSSCIYKTNFFNFD